VLSGNADTACHTLLQIRVLLMAGLLLVPADARGGQDPALTAAEIESAIFGKFGDTGPEYAAKVRC
jgi:hypothetical protein